MIIYEVIIEVDSYAFCLRGIDKNEVLRQAYHIVSLLTDKLVWNQSHRINFKLSQMEIVPLSPI